MVPLYVPATRPAGIVTVTVGSHEEELLSVPTHAPPVPGAAIAARTPGVKVPSPDDVAVPELYATFVFEIVSDAVAVPVVKSVDDTVAVQSATSAARSSVTVTVPS
jgi:hypothetical protein